MNYSTTFLDLCVDDKTEQTAPKHEKGHTASQTTCFTKSCQHGSRTRADQQRHEDKKREQANSSTLVLKETRTKNKTWEASTLTGVLREQQEATRRDKNNLPVSSTCCHLNTVAMLLFRAASSNTPKNLLKQIQRCISLSSHACFSAFLMSQCLACAILSSVIQHLGGRTNLILGSLQQFLHKLDVSTLVAGEALLDHAELNSEAFVFRSLACCGTGSEESICQALAIVHA